MAQASELSPELSRGLLRLARAPVGAARNGTLYRQEHPAVAPDALMINAAPADAAPAGIAEAAASLHDRDLLRVAFAGEVPPEAIHPWLRLLANDPTERRAHRAPARD